MSLSHEQKVKDRLRKVWQQACLLEAELEGFDDLFNSRSAEFVSLQSCQAAFRDWRGFNLGEFLNRAGIPADKRGVTIRGGTVVHQK